MEKQGGFYTSTHSSANSGVQHVLLARSG